MKAAAIILAVGLCLAGIAGMPAAARDSNAPPGSSPRWLPCEDWVMYHWLPYDEPRLYSLMGVGHDVVLRWLRKDQRRTLADLARLRGKDPGRLADGLVGPWRGHVSDSWYAVLRDRTLRTLTQGHLAQHLFFHTFHQPSIAIAARLIFREMPVAYQRDRLAGRSPAEIGASRGRNRRTVASLALRRLRQMAALGVSERATTRAQANRFLARQRRGVPHWLDSQIRKPGFKVGLRPHLAADSREQLLCFLLRGHSDPLDAAVSLFRGEQWGWLGRDVPPWICSLRHPDAG
jgi:hypothetical protein